MLPTYVRFMSPLGKMKQTFLWESFHILSHTEILSHWEGCQISLLLSSGENSSGPWAILAQFCSYSFQNIHTCLCVTSLSLLDCNPKCWRHGSGRRNSRHCTSWRERAGDGHQLWQVALPVLTPSSDLSLPSSSATLPLEAGKLIFLLVFFLPSQSFLSCIEMWDRLLSSTYGQSSKTCPQRVLKQAKPFRDLNLLKILHPVSRSTLATPFQYSTFNFFWCSEQLQDNPNGSFCTRTVSLLMRK